MFIKLNNHAGSYDTLYLVDNSNSDVVTYWAMIRTHVVPDRQRYIGLRQAHMLYRIDNSMIGTHQVQFANVGMIRTWCKHVIVNLFKRIFDKFQTMQHPH